ncbi:fluoride efflux transporter FluC [Senegalimassilia sp.]
MSLTTFLLVGLGGACGALCRHKALTFLKPKAAGPFPWPTLLVNLVSCTIAGAALAGCLAMGQMAYTTLTMGFLGGFSTLSTMNCEAVDLAGEGRRGVAAAYVAATYALTLGAAGAGFAGVSALL